MEIEQKHLLAAQMLANGERKLTIAKKLGIATSTLRRWEKEPEFKKLLASELERQAMAQKEIRDDALSKYRQAIERAAGLSLEVVNQLYSIVVDPDSSSRDKISASRELLSVCDKLFHWDVEEQVNELRELIEQHRKESINQAAQK